MGKKDELLIKEIHEYVLDKKTYKGFVKTLKVNKILEPRNEYSSAIIVLENGQELCKTELYDLQRRSLSKRDFAYDLDCYGSLLTIEKIPNIKEVFKSIKESHIEILTNDIKDTEKAIINNEKSIKTLKDKLEKYKETLKVIKGA